MSHNFNLKKFSFLVYGLGSTGSSVVKYLKKRKIRDFFVWDDNIELRKKFGYNKKLKLDDILKKVDYIILSPGISLKKAKHKNKLIKFGKKIITDLDLLYLSNLKFKSIVVTGTNGKSTTCKIIAHLLKKNKFEVKLGGNIGTPILNLKIKKDNFIVIEASSFQLSHSKFIHPDYAILLNVTNDHLDWHGSKISYIKSKFKIFKLQKRKDFALLNNKLLSIFKNKKFSSKLISINFEKYKKIKFKIRNYYLSSSINDENMSFAYALSKLLKINESSFIKSMNSFVGLPHRHEIILKKKGITFINDSKATSFQATKYALATNKNIYWILGGLPKEKDKIDIKQFKNNIIKTYIIGKSTNFFKNQIKDKIKFVVSKNLKKALSSVLKDIKNIKKTNNTILLSPSAASFDQFKNFENRGNEFKRLSKLYAKEII